MRTTTQSQYFGKSTKLDEHMVFPKAWVTKTFSGETHRLLGCPEVVENKGETSKRLSSLGVDKKVYASKHRTIPSKDGS